MGHLTVFCFVKFNNNTSLSTNFGMFGSMVSKVKGNLFSRTNQSNCWKTSKWAKNFRYLKINFCPILSSRNQAKFQNSILFPGPWLLIFTWSTVILISSGGTFARIVRIEVVGRSIWGNWSFLLTFVPLVLSSSCLLWRQQNAVTRQSDRLRCFSFLKLVKSLT